MDKEILRIVIIASGLVVILGMIAWSYLKEKKSEREREFYDDPAKKDSTGASMVETAYGPEESIDDYEIIRLDRSESYSTSDHYYDDDEEEEQDHAHHEHEKKAVEHDEEWIEPSRFITPSIIQFGIVANADEGFNGADLIRAFDLVGLEYSSMKTFERLDDNRKVDFGVACMVEPGTFPDNNVDDFYCPGILFFMQPLDLENAQIVFDDFVQTMKILATELDGVIWDHQKRPLTKETIEKIRHSL